jgi:hypothetical protein
MAAPSYKVAAIRGKINAAPQSPQAIFRLVHGSPKASALFNSSFSIINGSVVIAPERRVWCCRFLESLGVRPEAAKEKPLIIKRKNKKESNYGFQINRRAGDVQRDGKKVRSN